MKKFFTASAMAIALTAATATAPLAEGREMQMTEQQVAAASVSTQSSPDSMGPAFVLGLVTLVLIIAATSNNAYYHLY